MIFASSIFVFIFFPVVLLLYYCPLWNKRTYIKNWILLLGSLFFYAWGEPRFVFVMLLSIIITWGFGWLIGGESKYKHFFLLIGVGYHVVVLIVFKYLTFIFSQFGIEIHIWNNSLPIGISFFSFQMISYLVDVYQKKADCQKCFFEIALYISFFPQLIAGPIVRYNTISHELNERNVTFEDMIQGMKLFIYGISKKVLLADYLAVIADSIFDYSLPVSVPTAWLGAVAYTLQIYYDFSGYSDMAIGIGRIFGFHFPKNFDYPYRAVSVTDFWHKWHITLSEWFRDYVYIPLGGNRDGMAKWIRNMIIVWLLTGIWHGAKWTFWVWGAIYCVFLIGERIIGLNKKKKYSFIANVYTMFIVILLWVIFRADDLKCGLIYICNMLGISCSKNYSFFITELKGTWPILIIATFFAFPIYPKLSRRLNNTFFLCIEPFVCILLFVLSIIHVIGAEYSPFIYFNF